VTDAGTAVLASDRSGRPAFELSIFLSARPAVRTATVADLVESGIVAFTLTIAPFAETVRVTLLTGRAGARRVAAVTTTRGAAQIPVRAALGRADATDLLAAVGGSGDAWIAISIESQSGGRATTRAWETSVGELIGDLGHDATTIYYPDPDHPARFRPLEPLVSAPAVGNGSRGGGPVQHLVSRGFSAPTARDFALTPDRALSPSAHALIGSDASHRIGAGAWAAHDLILATPSNPIEALPIVEDSAALLWVDRSAPDRRFFPPAFTVRRPAPADPPAASAFAFVLTRTGTTTDPSKPTLTATVRFTLDAGQSDATAAALAAAGAPAAQAVPLGNLSVRLDVPFRDEATSEAKTQSFVADVSLAGSTVVATIELQNDWVRLLYGALAYPGFQSEPARLRIAYAFSAYVPIEAVPIRLAFVDKVAAVQFVSRSNGSALYPGPTLDVATGTVQLHGAAIRLDREVPTARRVTSHGAQIVAFHPTAASTAVATVAVAPAPAPAVAVHPVLSLPAFAVATLREPRYSVQTIVREAAVDVLLPCDTYGAFYLQNGDTGQVAIGCSDVLKLGQLTYHLYDELPDLRAATHRVFRSLQQPGRYLVLPTTYRVTRYAHTEPPERRGRPAAMIYALVGDTPDQSTYWFTATLEPDVPEGVRARLVADLASLAPAGVIPALDFPTDPAVGATVSYTWAVPDGVGTPVTHALWNSFQVSLSTSLYQGVVLKELIEHSGVRGAAKFSLPDGTAPLSSELVIDTAVTGPWIGGPVPATLDGAAAVLRNVTPVPVDVTAVEVRRAGATALDRVAVAKTVAPGEELRVDLGAGADAAFADYAPPAAAPLALLGVFEEDVATNVTFVNQVALANHALTSLTIRARVEGTIREYEATLGELATATLNLAFPLTTYLQDQTVQYRLTAIPVSGPPRDGPWLGQNLGTAGSIIGITADQLP
jgi:hypothetical protein